MKRIVKFSAVILMCLVLLVTELLLSVAADTVKFTAPKITAEPQYIYEIAQPTADLKTTDGFAPVFSAEYKEGAPKISSITVSAMPDDSIVIEGKGFSNATVYTCGPLADGFAYYRKALIINNSDTTITAIIDENYAYGIYYVWVKTDSGMSYPVRVNAPEIDWIDKTEAAQNEVVSIYGENLSFRNEEETSHVYIEGYGYAETNFVNPYKVSFVMPNDIGDGGYKVYVNNGHGANAWSNPITITVNSKLSNIWTGKRVTVEGFTIQDIENAISEAKDYDTVYFPEGIYSLDSKVTVTKKLKFVGESRDGVTIEITDNIGNTNDQRRGFSISAFPCEFSDMTIRDNPNSVHTPSLVYANGKNATENVGFAVKNCNFYICKTYTSKPTTNNTYNASDYANIENFVADTKTNMVRSCIELSYLKNAVIQDCYFEAPKPIDAANVDGLTVINNMAYGTWIMDYENGPCFVQPRDCNRIDISNNEIYGKDKATDPDGELEEMDRTFARAIVFHGTVRGAYIGDNVFDRVGSYIRNSGELILFENMNMAYIGSPSNVGGTMLTLEKTESVTGFSEFKGYMAVVLHGDGTTQYREIVLADTDSITVDSPWDVLPTSSSKIAIVPGQKDVSIYNNGFTGPSAYNTQRNALTAVSLASNVIDVRISKNKITQVTMGIACRSRYTLDSYTNGSKSYCFLVDAIISDNIVTNTKDGIATDMRIQADSHNFDLDKELCHVIQNLVIKRNIIDKTSPIDDSTIFGGGDGITVGTYADEYIGPTWDNVKVNPGAWAKNTVVENNKFTNMKNSNIRLQYHQADTIVRDNIFDISVEDVAYDSVNEAPSVPKAIIYNTPLPDSIQIGDVNVDGEVNLLDIVKLKKAIREKDFAEIYFVAADLNEDNDIDGNDICEIRKELLNQ